MQAIASVQAIPNDRHDILRWKHSRNGICTTKDIYKQLSAQNTTQLPQQAPKAFSPKLTTFCSKRKSKDLPPIIKAFTWRLIHQALATAERAAWYSTHIDNHCSACGAVEDDAHLFFRCNLPQAVWFSFTPSVRTDDLPHENDGVQQILHNLIPNSTYGTHGKLGMTITSENIHGLPCRYIMRLLPTPSPTPKQDSCRLSQTAL